MKFSATPVPDDLGVSPETIVRIVGEMRQIMCRDLEEIDIALEAYLFNRQIDHFDLLAVWRTLGSTERAAWKAFVDQGRDPEGWALQLKVNHDAH